MKAIGYARASTDEQRITIKKQERRIEEYAEEHGYELEDVFAENVSGRSSILRVPDVRAALDLSERKELKRTLMDAVGTGADAIIVLNPSRLARKAHYQGMLEEWFAEAGVPVEYVEGSGSWIEHRMKAVINEYEVRRTVQRTSDALQEKIESGEWVGNPPLGYMVREDDPHLHRDPDVWPAIEEAKRLYRAEHIGYGGVAEKIPMLSRSQVRTVVNRDEERYERFLPPEAEKDGD